MIPDPPSPAAVCGLGAVFAYRRDRDGALLSRIFRVSRQGKKLKVVHCFTKKVENAELVCRATASSRFAVYLDKESRKSSKGSTFSIVDGAGRILFTTANRKRRG